jgi:hypothetical protein
VSLADWFQGEPLAPPPHATRPSELPRSIALRDDIKRAWRSGLGMVPPSSRRVRAAWRADPTTRFLVAALIRNADECADQWHQLSWVGGNADQRTLDGLRERADTLRGIAEADYDALCEVLGLEPEKEERAA